MSADTLASPSVNAVLPCGTESARRRHLAHGRICPACEPEVEWPVRCPLCLDTVTAVGLVIQPHRVSGRGHRMPGYDCPGNGMSVKLPPWSTPVVAVAA